MAGSEGGGNEGDEDGTDGRAFCVFAEDDNFETRPVRAGATCCAAAEGDCFKSVPSFCAFVDEDDVNSTTFLVNQNTSVYFPWCLLTSVSAPFVRYGP